jgi:ribosome-associated translation inhibitor RaiA
MNIITRANDFPLTGAIDEYVKGELRSAFQTLDAAIVSIDVSMKDANGPKGGVDKQVLICVRLRNHKQVALETAHENLYAAIKTGVKRTRRTVQRTLRKSRRVDRQTLRELLDDDPLTAAPRA